MPFRKQMSKLFSVPLLDVADHRSLRYVTNEKHSRNALTHSNIERTALQHESS